MKAGDKVRCRVTHAIYTVNSSGTFIGGTKWIKLEEAPYSTFNPESFDLIVPEKIEDFPKLNPDVIRQFTAPVSARHNEGKVQTRELDPAFILGMGEVLTKSRAKYEHYNWCKPTKLSTPYESVMRHLLAFQSGEDVDKETGLSHLLHVATNIMFMHYHITNNPEESDDRFFKKDKK